MEVLLHQGGHWRGDERHILQLFWPVSEIGPLHTKSAFWLKHFQRGCHWSQVLPVDVGCECRLLPCNFLNSFGSVWGLGGIVHPPTTRCFVRVEGDIKLMLLLGLYHVYQILHLVDFRLKGGILLKFCKQVKNQFWTHIPSSFWSQRPKTVQFIRQLNMFHTNSKVSSLNSYSRLSRSPSRSFRTFRIQALSPEISGSSRLQTCMPSTVCGTWKVCKSTFHLSEKKRSSSNRNWS